MSDGDYYEQLSREICLTSKPGLATTILHKALERSNGNQYFTNVLEIGGNVGEHLQYVRHEYSNYIVSDIRKISLSERNAYQLNLMKNVKFEVADCQNLKYRDGEFDRVIITCVLHHIPNLEKALQEIYRVTSVGGQIDILLPCDPGMLYRLSRQITSLRTARKMKMYEQATIFHAREHRNHFDSILKLIKFNFRENKLEIKYWPWRIRSWNFSVFASIRIRKEKVE